MANHINLGSDVLVLMRRDGTMSSPIVVRCGVLKDRGCKGGGMMWAGQFANSPRPFVVVEVGGELHECGPRDVRKDTPKNREYFRRQGRELDVTTTHQ